MNISALVVNFRQRTMFKAPATAVFLLASVAAFAEEHLDVEWVAAEIARQHNSKAHTMTDDMTISSSADSKGKNVILRYVWKARRDISHQKLKELDSELRTELIPKVCAENAVNPAFKQGLSYTFVYVSHYGQKLAQLSIDKHTCGM